MTWDLFFRILSAIATIATMTKIIYEISKGNKQHLRDEYRFAKDFFDDIKSKQDMHVFVLTKGYQTIAGNTYISNTEIELILTLENPVTSLHDFILSKKYLLINEFRNYKRIEFKPSYLSKWSRLWRKSLFLNLYGLLSIIALTPLIFGPLFKIQHSQLFILTFFSIPTCGFYAYIALVASLRIARAERLVSIQSKRVNSIVTSA